MENFLYGMLAGVGVTIISLIIISQYLFPTKKPKDNEWEA